jgi:predicted RecA/RadA family phage recombinase
MKNFIQPGDVITWTNGTGSAVASGDVVVMKHTIGVACVDIANGASGEVSLAGVYTLVKASAAVVVAGEKLLWDASESNFDDSSASPASGDILGAAIAVEGAGSGVLTVKAKLVGPGALS